MNKHLFIISALLISLSLQCMEFDFLQFTTNTGLHQFRANMCKTAAKNDCEQLVITRREYLRIIDMEKCILKIKMYDHNQEEIKKNLGQLQTHAFLTFYKALYHAINCGNYETAKDLLTCVPSDFLQEKDNPECLLHIACFGKWHDNEEKTIEIIDLMLKAGANINQTQTEQSKNYKTSFEATPLDVAIGNYRSDCTAPVSIQKFLKEKGAR